MLEGRTVGTFTWLWTCGNRGLGVRAVRLPSGKRQLERGAPADQVWSVGAGKSGRLWDLAGAAVLERWEPVLFRGADVDAHLLCLLPAPAG